MHLSTGSTRGSAHRPAYCKPIKYIAFWKLFLIIQEPTLKSKLAIKPTHYKMTLFL